MFTRGIMEQVRFVQNKVTAKLDAARKYYLTERAYGQSKFHSETAHLGTLLFTPKSKTIARVARKFEAQLPDRFISVL